MKDLFGNESGCGELIVTAPAKSHKNLCYAVLVGDRLAYSSNFGLYKVTDYFRIRNLSVEQQEILVALQEDYVQYTQTQVKGGTRLSVVPRVGGIYIANTQKYVYLYVGKYVVDIPYSDIMTVEEELITGGNLYLKIAVNGYAYKKLMNFLNFEQDIDEIKMANFLDDYFCSELSSFKCRPSSVKAYILATRYHFYLSRIIFFADNKRFTKEVSRLRMGDREEFGNLILNADSDKSLYFTMRRI